MNKTSLQKQFATVVAALFFAVGIATAKDTVAIKGRLTGESTITPLSNTELLFQQANIATGQISHLGRVTAEWIVREVRIDASYSQLVVGQPDWVGTITTASGDQLSGTYTFRATTLAVSKWGDVTFVADLNVTGGTGRFEGATGHGVSNGRGNIWTRKFIIELNGTLTKK